jgi:hypothetical protein
MVLVPSPGMNRSQGWHISAGWEQPYPRTGMEKIGCNLTLPAPSKSFPKGVVVKPLEQAESNVNAGMAEIVDTTDVHLSREGTIERYFHPG